MKPNLFIFPFMSYVFSVISKKLLVNSSTQRFTSTFPSNYFTILALTFRSLNICICCKMGVQLHSFEWCGCSVVPALFSPLNCPVTLVKKKKKNQWTINVRAYLWVFHSIPLIYASMSVRMPVPHFLDYCVVSFDIRKWTLYLCSFSRLIWLFWVPCISIWVSGSVFQFLQRKHLELW